MSFKQPYARSARIQNDDWVQRDNGHLAELAHCTCGSEHRHSWLLLLTGRWQIESHPAFGVLKSHSCVSPREGLGGQNRDALV